MGIIDCIEQLETRCVEQIKSRIETGDSESEAKSRCRFSMKSKIELIIDKHFQKHSEQFEFLKGNRTKRIYCRLKELLEKYCAKRDKKGSLKFDGEGKTKYKNYRFFGLPDEKFFEQYQLLKQESEDILTASNFPYITIQSKKDQRTANWIIALASPLVVPCTFGGSIYMMFGKDFSFNKTLQDALSKAKQIDYQLEEKVKPYLTDYLNGNYREPGLLVGE